MPVPILSTPWFDLWIVGISATVALAAIATIAYVFVVRARKPAADPLRELAEMEVRRAAAIARELEHFAAAVRKDLGANRRRIVRLKSKVAALPARDADVSQAFFEKAERMLAPTFKLAAQLSSAYDELREHLSRLLTFAECRMDPLTGVANRRALDEHLTLLFGMLSRNDRPFTIAIFSVDQFQQVNDQQGTTSGEKVLYEVANLFRQTVRETDFVARCGGEEFVVVMPKTRLFGGSAFGERLRSLVEQKLSFTVSGGTTEANPQDTSQTLLARADSALYSAKAAGRNVVFQHNGSTIRQVEKQSAGKAGTAAETAKDAKNGRPGIESKDLGGTAEPRPLEPVGSRSG